MTDENGILSIDFLAGFTIFILAFIWVVSMIPGLMIGLQSYTIDSDAVAYRTGVILMEDPGWPFSPPWESYIDPQKNNVTRFGLALSKDTPNILSQDKVNRFFCATAFIYPDDYRTRAIFGDYPYGFNISLIDIGGHKRSVGDVLPDGYGYIRRVVKIKGTSNATINNATYSANPSYIKTDNATNHVFSILINNTKLLGDVKDPAYQIDPAREQITINITDLKLTITEFPPDITRATSTISLQYIKIYKQDGSYVNPPLSDYPFIDGSSTRVPIMPWPVTDNVTLRFSPQFLKPMLEVSPQIYIALGFSVTPASTFLNNTCAIPNFYNLDGQLTFNNPNTTPFDYNYDPKNVTQPYLRDAVVEVAVWSGAATGLIGPLTTPTPGTHTIYATAGSNGAISPIGSVSVNNGTNQLFNIIPNANYHITDVVVDGVSNGTISNYTFISVMEDHTIAALFAIDTYNITASAGAGGTITPAGDVSVNYGANQPFTIAHNAGYHINDVLVNGSSVGAVASYIFPAVTANHTIAASFAANAPVSIFSDNFEAGFSGWTSSGNVGRQTGSVPKNGTASIQLNNTGSMRITIPTSGFSSIGVSFAMAANSLDNAGESVYARWYDGSTYTVMKQITYNGGENDNTLRSYSYSLPTGAANNPNFQLSFNITGSSTNDYGYVDDVRVTGVPD